jgi:hypothetical protein
LADIDISEEHVTTIFRVEACMLRNHLRHIIEEVTETQGRGVKKRSLVQSNGESEYKTSL